VMNLSFSNTMSETYLFYKDENIILRNLRATEEFISGLGAYCVEKGNFIWKRIDAIKIVDFLAHYQAHPNARLANTRLLIDYIQLQIQQNELTSWTVALISKNNSEKYTIAGLEVGLIERSNAAAEYLTEYRISKSRLLDPSHEMLDFSEEDQREILRITAENRREKGKPESKSKTTPDGKVIRAKRNRRNGLILLYPLDPKAINGQTPVVGFGISFPKNDSAKAVEYKVNNVYWEQEFLDSYED
jgi:hypothetical protein